MKEKTADPLRLPDLSLSIIKLMGAGEYIADFPGDTPPSGHVGLAVRDDTHSTAPNRRSRDLIVPHGLSGCSPCLPEVNCPPFFSEKCIILLEIV